MRGSGGSRRGHGQAMSRGESPWGGDRSANPATPGENEPGGTDDEPARNPWLSPDEASTSRRSASIEDILRSRGGGQGGGGPGRARIRLLPWLGLALGLTWLGSTSIHFLATDERALVTTMGRYADTIGPGFNVTLPWPLQSVESSEVGKELFSSLPGKEAETLMLTRDGELVDLSFQVRWRISDLRAFTYNLPEGEAALRRLADAQMRATVAEFDFNTITSGKRQAELQQRVAGRMQRVLDAWRSGITLAGVELTRSAPPAKLADTFKKIADARDGESKNLENAMAWRDLHLRNARAEAKDFNFIYTEYKLAPEVTRQRMYYEMMERVLRNNDKVVIGGTQPAPADPAPAKEGR